MLLEEAKQELIKRYRYLYENAYFILAPYMYEQEQKENKKTNQDFDFQESKIYLNINILDGINFLFEEFLLSDKSMEKSALYKMIESKRCDKEYLEQVKVGLNLVEKLNARISCFKETLTIWNILNLVSSYVSEQSGDLKNKERKLCVIDEYYRIARYRNNGNMYTSGRVLNFHDTDSMVIPIHRRLPIREKKDIGVTENEFITTIVYAPKYKNNMSIFTEKEKQKIYLDYHDELPCDLKITCDIGLDCDQMKLVRPDNTECCEKEFIIKEDEIFVNPNDDIYRYYQMCPHCGYIVNIPNENLSEGIMQRIEDRCNKDLKLFRKMYLYSELFSLDNKSINGQKKLLKK